MKIATMILLPVLLAMFTFCGLAVTGCADPFADAQAEAGDTPEMLELKKEKAALIAEITRIKDTYNEEMRKLRAENDAKIKAMEARLATEVQEQREQIFPGRIFHLFALAILAFSGFAAWREGRFGTLLAGIVTAGIIMGFAGIQKDHPEFLQYQLFAVLPLTFIYWLYSRRADKLLEIKDRAIAILARYIEACGDEVKAAIKRDPEVAAFVETQVRQHLNQQAKA